MDIFQKIKELRTRKKLSQKDVADALGISQAAYAKIEKPINPDSRKISIEYGKVIAKTLGISFNELFEIELPSQEEKKLLPEIEKLKNEILKLEEQLNDKRRIIEFISKRDNDFLIAVASYIAKKEKEENPDETDYDSRYTLESILKWRNKNYDPAEKDSMMRYITKYFDKYLK